MLKEINTTKDWGMLILRRRQMKWMRLIPFIILLIAPLERAVACSEPHPYAWMDLIVPEIEFKQTHVTNVAAFFNVFIAQSVTNRPTPRISVAPGTFEPKTGNPSQEIPLITFSARYVQIGCALKIISAVAGMTYRASETGAVFNIMKSDPTYSPVNEEFTKQFQNTISSTNK